MTHLAPILQHKRESTIRMHLHLMDDPKPQGFIKLCQHFVPAIQQFQEAFQFTPLCITRCNLLPDPNQTFPRFVVPLGHPVFKAQEGFLIDHTTMTALFYYGTSSKASLPEGVLAIQDKAFMNHPKLKELTLPSTLEKIGSMAFTGSVFTKFTVANGNTSFEAKDGILFEKGLEKLLCYPPSATASKYKMPDETTAVAERAFFEVKNLKSLDLNAVVSLGEYAVSCTGKKNLRITSMAAVREIGKQAFQFCSFGDRLTLPGDLKTLEWGAFYGAAFKHLVLEEGIRQVPAYAFARNKALLTVQIPQSITTVEGAAFEDCTSLREIRGVEYLDSLDAFKGCEKLPSSYFK